MKRIWLLSLTLIGLGVVLFFIASTSRPELGMKASFSNDPERSRGAILHRSPPAPSVVLPSPVSAIQYQSYTLAQSTVRTLLIPTQSQFVVTPAVSPEVDTLEGFTQKHRALAALNGGFFDPQNQKSTSYIIVQGQQQADPKLNERLMGNSDLKPYLDQILNRAEFRRYRCGQTVRYDITLHSEPPPAGCRLIDALGGGPRLLPEITAVQEGFLDYDNGNVIRDPLRSSQPDARTAIGITHDNSVVWVMAAQKPESPTTSGMSLQKLADLMKTLGVAKAMTLDGGSSSSLYFKGKTFYGKVDSAGNLVERPVKSVLLVQEVGVD